VRAVPQGEGETRAGVEPEKLNPFVPHSASLVVEFPGFNDSFSKLNAKECHFL
jgi:hypothetical protein